LAKKSIGELAASCSHFTPSLLLPYWRLRQFATRGGVLIRSAETASILEIVYKKI